MTDKEKIKKLRETLSMVLTEGLSSFPDNCDCGGSDLCVTCYAWEVLKETEK